MLDVLGAVGVEHQWDFLLLGGFVAYKSPHIKIYPGCICSSFQISGNRAAPFYRTSQLPWGCRLASLAGPHMM